MSVVEILDTVQYVIDREGHQTAVLLDLQTWEALRHLLEELAEDERLGQLIAAVEGEEKLEGEAAVAAYRAFLAENRE